MLGGGGSMLAVPILFRPRPDVHQATAASMVVVTAGALVGLAGLPAD